MSGFNSCLDDLEAIRKRREELFPKPYVKPEEPFEQPIEPERFEGGVTEDYGCYPSTTGDPEVLSLMRKWNDLKARRYLWSTPQAAIDLILPRQ